jgi:hypothetical protein
MLAEYAVLYLHLQGRVDARGPVGEGGDQRAVAQRRGRNGVEQLAQLGALEHRCLARLNAGRELRS